MKSGDVVHYSEFVLFPETLDAAWPGGSAICMM